MKENHTTQFSCSQESSENKFEITDADREMENGIFETYLRNECQEDHEIVRTRMQYVREYCLSQPEFDGYDFFLSEEAIWHCRTRVERLKFTDICESEFYELDELQEAIEKLHLCKEATFEFILYLWFHLKTWKSRGTHERIGGKIEGLKKSIKENPTDPVEITISLGRNKITYNHCGPKESLIEYLDSLDDLILDTTEIQKTKIGQAQYYLFMSLLKDLPIKHDNPKKGIYSQAEINLALSALWLVKEKIRKDDEQPCNFSCIGMNSKFYEVVNRYKGNPVVHIGPRL